jgi:hypothetical protein
MPGGHHSRHIILNHLYLRDSINKNCYDTTGFLLGEGKEDVSGDAPYTTIP